MPTVNFKRGDQLLELEVDDLAGWNKLSETKKGELAEDAYLRNLATDNEALLKRLGEARELERIAKAPAPVEKSAIAKLADAQTALDSYVQLHATKHGISKGVAEARLIGKDLTFNGLYAALQVAKHVAVTNGEQMARDPSPAVEKAVNTATSAFEQHVTKLAAARGEPYPQAVVWALSNDATAQQLYADFRNAQKGE